MKIDLVKHIYQMAKSSRSRRHVTICMGVLMAVLGALFCGHALVAHALDPIPVSVASGLQAGVVTSIGQQALFLNGKEYTLDPEIDLRDQEDNVLEPEVIKVNHEVKFHLKKGDSNKIDLMIVYMPQ